MWPFHTGQQCSLMIVMFDSQPGRRCCKFESPVQGLKVNNLRVVTCVEVMRVLGLKVNRPCSSSNRSSPAALNMCSSGVPGNSLKDT